MNELRRLAWLRERALWLALLLALCAWSLAYQSPFAATFHFGGDPTTGRRYDDAPFVQGFNAPEPADRIWWEAWRTLGPNDRYRWAEPDATIRLTGVGGGLWRVALRAQGQPGGNEARWEAGNASGSIQLSDAPRRYILAVPASGDLVLRITTPLLRPRDDPRNLGFVAYSFTVTPAGPVLPPMRELALAGAVLLLSYGTLRRTGAGVLVCLLALAGLISTAALLIVTARLAFAGALLPLAWALLAGYVLAVAVVYLLQRRGVVQQEAMQVALLLVVALAVRAVALFHPHTIFSDIGLNANNLLGVGLGDIFFTEGLPADAGGGQVPYPPLQYVALLPFSLLVTPEGASREWIIALGGLLDALGALWVWLLLRRWSSRQAALFGAGLYTIAPPMMHALSTGEFANVFGQSVALGVVALLALAGPLLSERRWWLSGALGVLAALLSHLGVTISLALLLGCLLLVWAAHSASRRQALALLGLCIAGGVVAVLLYHTALLDALLATRTVPADLPALTLAQKLRNQLNDLRGISPALVGLGVFGSVLIWWRAEARPLALLLAAWWAATVLSFGLLLFASQGVRWQHFLFPALCLGAGVALAWRWERNRVARIFAGALWLWLLADGAWFAIARFRDYLHS